MKKMICPIADVCDSKPIWVKPIWEVEPKMTNKGVQLEGVQIGETLEFQGHCKPHEHCSQCDKITSKCPACIEVKEVEEVKNEISKPV